MLSNEDLLAISMLLDKKLDSVKKDIADDIKDIANDMEALKGDMQSGFQKINITLENEMLPRLQNIESCYTTTYKRYQSGVNQIEAMQADIDIMKKVISELSEKMQKLENVS